MAWNEFNDSPREKVKNGGIEVTRKVWGPWEERYDLLTDPNWSIYPGLSAVNLQSVDFEPWPKCPEKDLSDRSTTTNNYEFVKATLTYSTPTVSGGGGGGGGGRRGGSPNSKLPKQEEVEEEIDGSSYYTIQVDGDLEVDFIKGSGKYKWDNAPAENKVPLNYTKKFRVPFLNIQLTRNRWAEPDWPNLDLIMGSVNENPYDIPVVDIPAPTDTLLFNSYSASYRVDSEELGVPSFVWDVTYHLQYRWLKNRKFINGQGKAEDSGIDQTKAIGWNHFYCEALGAWDRITHVDDTDDNTRFIFPRTNWKRLLS